ncbi:hypothetical protein LCGC14_0391370 [marine sediment metagenome]|uniref:Uncharacterized protein n=1 Tax=marine sediment metagenome TaxID=412755 RepID=A0A0F9VLI8_9ZZZZ
MSTRLSIEQEVARRLGGRVGSITSGNATTTVLAGLIDLTGDDDAYKHWQLFMPDAATAADQSRVVTAWDDSTGTATFITRSDTTYTDETYILLGRGDPSKAAIDAALDEKLARTRFAAMSVFPTVEQQRPYWLGALSWVRSEDDVLAVFERSSPDLVDNGNFELWGDGSSSAPTRWTATTATVGRNNVRDNPERITRGAYSLSLAGSGATGTLDFDLAPELVIQLRGSSLTLTADVVAGAVTELIAIVDDDGSTTAAHTGGGGSETLSVTRTIGSTTTRIRFRLQAAQSVTGHFDHVRSNAGTSIASESDAAASALRYIPHEVRSAGGVAYIEVSTPTARGSQIVVFTAMPYPALSSDTDTTDCPDAVIVPGLLEQIAQTMWKHKDRTRWDRLLHDGRVEFMAAVPMLTKIPQPETAQPIVVTGA